MALQTIALNTLVDFGLAGSGTAVRTYTAEDGQVVKTSVAGPRKQHIFLSTDVVSEFVIPPAGSFAFEIPSPIDVYQIGDTVSIVDSLETPTKKVVAQVTNVVGNSIVAGTLSIAGSGTITNAQVAHNRPLGLKVDGPISQLVYDTELLVAGRTLNNSARTAFAGRLPDNTTGAGATITDTSTSIGLSSTPTISISNQPGNFVYSVWAKHGVFQTEPGGLNTAQLGYLRVNSQFGGVSYTQTALIDAINGQIKQLNTTDGFVGVGVQKYPNGWNRFWLVCKTDAASTSVQGAFAPGVASSSTQNNAQLFAATTVQNPAAYGQHHIWGEMLEFGATKTAPSDYVPNLATTAGTVTTPSEFAKISGTNFTKAFSPNSAGTVYIEAVAPSNTLVDSTACALTNAAGNRFLRIYRGSAANRVSAQAAEVLGTVTLNGAGPGETSANIWGANQTRRIALSWDSNGYALACEGSLIDFESLNSALPDGLDRFNIGSLLDSASGGQGSFLIKKVRGYKSKIIGSALTSLTLQNF